MLSYESKKVTGEYCTSIMHDRSEVSIYLNARVICLTNGYVIFENHQTQTALEMDECIGESVARIFVRSQPTIAHLSFL